MPIKNVNLYPYAGHHISQFLNQLTPATVWLLVIPITIIYLIFSRIGCNARAFFMNDDFNKLDDDEFVPAPDPHEVEYFDRMKHIDHQAWFKEEYYM